MDNNIEPVIRISGLSKHFGEVRALDNVSISVLPGRIFGFLGPNGAGKTTTIRCLMDFIRPNAGEVALFGKKYVELKPDVKNRIGFLSSEESYYKKWTARQHFRYVEAVRGRGSSALVLAERLGLELGTKVRKLSTGNRQKLGLILAMMHDPELLILDEPTSGLDPILQREFHKILREARDRGCTVFMSSHNLSEVQQVCDEVAIIRDGRIVANGSLESLRKFQTHEVRLRFDKQFDRKDFELPNVKILSSNNVEITANVTGDFNDFLKAAVKYHVRDIDITHASLEEIFMRYYND